jgi:hypothetical protein
LTDSIFETIKSMLGSDSDYTVFDNDIRVFINSAIATLTQIGIGPKEGFKISSDNSETWSDFIGERKDLESIKEYIYMKVRIAFDPPSNSSVLSSYKEACKEFEWRLNVASEEKY